MSEDPSSVSVKSVREISGTDMRDRIHTAITRNNPAILSQGAWPDGWQHNEYHFLDDIYDLRPRNEDLDAACASDVVHAGLAVIDAYARIWPPRVL